ncbi:MAG: hypothetical protein HYX48_06500 [Chlamydiales bacterium]|nr:hypothetical protein [Chlamydiales bacterium]
MRVLLCFLLFSSTINADKIDILANFTLDELCPGSQIAETTGFDTLSCYMPFSRYIYSTYSPDVKKIFLMNNFWSVSEVASLPKKKLVLFIWEPGGVSPTYCNFFSRVYTYNDNLVDGVKYFKFFYPVLTPMCSDLPTFDQKRLCVMVAHSSTKERVDMVRFFETKPEDEFEFYGLNPITLSDRYRGGIPGHPLSQTKFEVMKQFRFCVCFENSFINGYITEKIFACFAAGCIPIYLGAPNVEKYIPKECLIDYRDFRDNEELYSFIKTMPEEVYERYLSNIRKYLASEKAHLFSSEHFSETIKKAALATGR